MKLRSIVPIVLLSLLLSAFAGAETMRASISSPDLERASQLLLQRLEKEGISDVDVSLEKNRLLLTFQTSRDSEYLENLLTTPLIALCYGSGLSRHTVITDQHVESAEAVPGGYEGSWEVSFLTTKEGRIALAKATQNLLGKPLDIVIEGRVVASPIVQGPIRDGKVIVTGMFTREEASRIAELLSSGLQVQLLDLEIVP